jgi:hypothetical protein
VRISKAAKSILVFGIFMVLVGLGLLIMPDVLLTLSGYPTTSEVWIRVVGMVAAILGYYYIVAARNELTSLFKASVRARPAVIVCFIALVALHLAKPILILFGAIDLVGAIWTGLALRSPKESVQDLPCSPSTRNSGTSQTCLPMVNAAVGHIPVKQ